MIKIEKHGYFFKNGKLRTECPCGCVYLTPKRKVKVYTDYVYQTSGTVEKRMFSTKCPECYKVNRQFMGGVIKGVEGVGDE